MNQSLDSYVDHMAFAPSPALFRHWIEQVHGLTGSIYGRHIYDIMRYSDEEHPEWSAEEREFAVAWQNQPKWVVSRSLATVGPNATLINENLEAMVRGLKPERVGEVAVARPEIAQSLAALDLIEEYKLYVHPIGLGHSKPFFTSPRPPLRIVVHDLMDGT